MSIKALNHVWDNSSQDGGRLLCLLAIADYANEKWTAYPSLDSLSRKSRLSVRQVQRVLDKLVKDKEISILQGQGPQGCNLYHILKMEKQNVVGGDILSSGGHDISGPEMSPNPSGTTIDSLGTEIPKCTEGTESTGGTGEFRNGNVQLELPETHERLKKKKVRKIFVPPTISELSEYGSAINLSERECEKFLAHYEMTGWTIGKQQLKMVDWQAALRGWRLRGLDYKSKSGGKSYSSNI